MRKVFGIIVLVMMLLVMGMVVADDDPDAGKLPVKYGSNTYLFDIKETTNRRGEVVYIAKGDVGEGEFEVHLDSNKKFIAWKRKGESTIQYSAYTSARNVVNAFGDTDESALYFEDVGRGQGIAQVLPSEVKHTGSAEVPPLHYAGVVIEPGTEFELRDDDSVFGDVYKYRYGDDGELYWVYESGTVRKIQRKDIVGELTDQARWIRNDDGFEGLYINDEIVPTFNPFGSTTQIQAVDSGTANLNDIVELYDDNGKVRERYMYIGDGKWEGTIGSSSTAGDEFLNKEILESGYRVRKGTFTPAPYEASPARLGSRFEEAPDPAGGSDPGPAPAVPPSAPTLPASDIPSVETGEFAKAGSEKNVAKSFWGADADSKKGPKDSRMVNLLGQEVPRGVVAEILSPQISVKEDQSTVNRNTACSTVKVLCYEIKDNEVIGYGDIKEEKISKTNKAAINRYKKAINNDKEPNAKDKKVFDKYTKKAKKEGGELVFGDDDKVVNYKAPQKDPNFLDKIRKKGINYDGKTGTLKLKDGTEITDKFLVKRSPNGEISYLKDDGKYQDTEVNVLASATLGTPRCQGGNKADCWDRDEKDIQDNKLTIYDADGEILRRPEVPEYKVDTTKGKTPVILYKTQDGRDFVSIGSGTVSRELYDKYKTQIDFDNPAGHAKQSLSLQNGGRVSEVDLRFGVSERTVKIDKTSTEEKSWIVPILGEDEKTITYHSDKGWTGTSSGSSVELTHKDEGSISITQNQNVQTIERLDKREGEHITTVVTTGEDGKKFATKTVRDKNKKGDLESYETFDNEGNRVGRSESIDDGKVKKFVFIDENGDIIGACQGPCIGDPRDGSNVWVDKKGDNYCTGSKAQCLDGENDLIKVTGECGVFTAANTACSEKSDELFWRFSSDFWTYDITAIGSETTGVRHVRGAINALLSLEPGYQGLSAFLFEDEVDEWNREAAAKFDKHLKAEYMLQDYCKFDELNASLTPGQAFTFIHTTKEQVQFTGSIQAEKTQSAGPVLCSEESPCARGECSNKGFCEDSDGIIEAIFYKITWGVTSPTDNAYTLNVNEAGRPAIKFNIQLIDSTGRKTFVYKNENGRGTSNTWSLENGARANDVILEYSASDYNEACITFGSPPLDLKNNEIGDICAKFVVNDEAGKVARNSAGRNTPRGTTLDDVKRAQI